MAAPGDTLEARRERILIAYLDQLPYTYRALLKYLSTVSDDFQVVLNNDAYELFIRIRLSGLTQRDALVATLGQMIPANLVLLLQTAIPQVVQSPPTVVGAAMVNMVRHEHIPQGGNQKWHDLSQRSPTRRGSPDAFLAAGKQLVLTSAAAGDGVAQVSPNTLTALVNPINVNTQIGEKTFVESNPSYMRIPVQVTNAGLESTVYVREVAVYALDENDAPFMFSYSWLDGEDSDNVLPPCSFQTEEGLAGEGDTVHVHDVAVVVTNQENSGITVNVGSGSYVTTAQMVAYAAPIVHGHDASQIEETTGETVETAQRRQDFDISAIQEQLDTGFTGTTVTHTFAPAQIDQWKGYDGTGLPEGILDTVENRLYL